MTEALVAGATSLTIGVFSTRYDQYAFWRAWSPVAASCGLGLLALVYAAAGIVGYLGADALSGGETGVAAAVAQGAAGHALLRAQIDRVGPETPPAHSALTYAQGWLVGLLETRARKRIDRWIKDLGGAELVELTFDLFWREVNNPDEEVAARLYALLKSAAADIDSDSPAAQADARGRLRGFCARELVRHRVGIEEAAHGR